MSIYICEKCGAIDNTALGGYWHNCRKNEPKMCSECNTGKWHGEFPKRYWNDEIYGVEKLLEMESKKDGSMINATEYLTKIGQINNEKSNINNSDNELKIYKITTNNGNWGGCNSHYIVAKSPEEALQDKNIVDYKNLGYDVWTPHEVNPVDLFGLSLCEKYDIDLNITVKEKVGDTNG